MAPLFHGSAICDVDADGTLSVPDFLSETLDSDAASDDLLVSQHEADRCLVGYGRDHLVTLRRRTERRRRADERAGRDPRGHHRRTRRTFGIVEPLARRPGGMQLSPAMRHLASIDRLALIVGTGDRFEIWNPDLAMRSDDDSVRDLAAYQLNARDAGAAALPGGE